jgi:hypothetical protein
MRSNRVKRSATSHFARLTSGRTRKVALCSLFGAALSGALVASSIAGDFDPRWHAPCPPGGVCVPKRVTYGYYPTLWRRWPGEPLPSSEQQQKPENVPAPSDAQKKRPATGSAIPDATNDIPIPPDEPQTSPLPDSMDEDSETSPALPRDLDQDLEQPSMDEDLRNQLPDSSGDSASEPMTPDTEPDSLPDSLPEATVPKSTEPDELNDDPFKDDELPDGDTSETVPHSGADQVTARFNGDKNSAIRWRSPKAAAPKRLEQQPGLLHADATRTAKPKRIVNEVKTVTTRNPLRPNAAPARRILPTAEWTAESEAASSGGEWRTNPLRSR